LLPTSLVGFFLKRWYYIRLGRWVFIPNPVDLFEQAPCAFETRAFGRVKLLFFDVGNFDVHRCAY
jgi:hypothetical protein